MRILTKNGMPEYYIESESELSSIPVDAPAGTIVQCNESNDFKVYMKQENGEFNEL
jgi:hypothetical protein